MCIIYGDDRNGSDYQALNVQSLRSFKDVYLVDFLKLPLKV